MRDRHDVHVRNLIEDARFYLKHMLQPRSDYAALDFVDEVLKEAIRKLEARR